MDTSHADSHSFRAYGRAGDGGDLPQRTTKDGAGHEGMRALAALRASSLAVCMTERGQMLTQIKGAGHSAHPRNPVLGAEPGEQRG
jgi:hypothetical protein